MKSKTKIEKQTNRKKNIDLVETIRNSKKNSSWFEIANLLSSPRKNMVSLNLEEINKNVKDGEIIVVPGKILSQGEMSKKIKIIALGFSEKAKEKLSRSKIEFSNINEEIKKNPSMKGIKILKVK